MHAVAVGWDWLYDAPPAALSDANRSAIAAGLAERGLQIAADNWNNGEFTVSCEPSCPPPHLTRPPPHPPH